MYKTKCEIMKLNYKNIFIIACVFNFSVLFIFSYCFELLSSVLIFQFTRVFLAFLTSLMVTISFSFYLPEKVLISPSPLKDNFGRNKFFSWLVFLSSLWVYLSTASRLPKYLMRSFLLILLRIPCMWWVTYLLML